MVGIGLRHWKDSPGYLPHQLKSNAEMISEVEVVNHVNDVVLVLPILHVEHMLMDIVMPVSHKDT